MKQKMYKRIISFFLVLSFIIGFQTGKTVVAYGENENQVAMGGKLDSYIQEILCDVDAFGYDRNEWGTLYIGNPIHSYRYLESDVLEECDYILYPLFAENKLLFFVIEHNDGIEITQALTNELASYINYNIAVICDSTDCYIYNGTLCQLNSVYSQSEPITDRGHLNDASEIREHLVTAPLIKCQEIQLSYDSKIQPYADPVFPTVTISVPIVLQGQYDNICWAASIASVGNKLTNRTVDAVTIAKYHYGSNFNKRISSLTIAQDVLNDYYSLNYKIWGTNLSIDRIHDNLSSGYPIMAGWTYTAYPNQGHMTVIRGINVTVNRIYIMDPLGGHATGTIKGGKYYYTSPYQGDEMILSEYVSYR